MLKLAGACPRYSAIIFIAGSKIDSLGSALGKRANKTVSDIADESCLLLLDSLIRGEALTSSAWLFLFHTNELATMLNGNYFFDDIVYYPDRINIYKDAPEDIIAILLKHVKWVIKNLQTRYN